ncbi:MAG: protein of unknown function with transrane region [Parcubacteria group bacterium]|nr:protein of unknown function with transrane region [Parcubacteria group bacterium]
MIPRILAVSLFLLAASFAAPHFASADTVCTSVNQPCINPGGISGTCDANMICQATQSQCQRQGINTLCITTSGVNGTCNASGACVPTSTTVTNPPSGQTITLINPLGSGGTASSFVSSIMDLVIRIGSIVIIFMLIYVGFLFVMARGNDAKLSEARKALLWTIVGALILLGAKAIALGIEATVQALSTGT